MAKRVLLLGAGPAHLQLLQALVQQPLAGAEVALAALFARQASLARVAGVVTGHRPVDDAFFGLADLAAAAQVHFIEAGVASLDAVQRRAVLTNGRVVDADVLSVDAGPVQDRDRIPGAREHGLFLHPAEHFLRLLEGLWDLAARQVLDVVVVGGGVAAVELALALSQRLTQGGEERARIALVTDSADGAEPLAGTPPAFQRRALQALARRRVTVFRDACRAIEPGAVVLASGARLACDAPLLATPAAPLAWLHDGSGLAQDTTGRDGHALEAQLRSLIGGVPLRAHRPPPPPPLVLELGDRRALAVWHGQVVQGRWVQWRKDRHDARLLARCSPSPSGGRPG